MAYPTVSDVEDRMEAMGLTAPDNGITQALINASVVAWENMTGYHPFLNADETETTRYFPVNNGIIDFQGGILAVPTTLNAGGYYNESGAYTGGTARVVGRDYILKPDNALLESKPYTYAVTPGWYDSEKSPLVAITAPFGYCSTLPDDAWAAIMDEVLTRQQAIQPATGANAQKIKQGPVEWDYGSGNSGATFSVNLMSRFAQMTAAAYRRARIA